MDRKYRRMEVVPGEIEQLRSDLKAANLQIESLKKEVARQHGDPFTCGHEPAFAGGACAACHAEELEANGELFKHLKYVCMIAERLGSKVSGTHREEALAMLDGTVKEAREALAKYQKPECDCVVPALDGAGQHSPSCSIFKREHKKRQEDR
jgi:hypothetical protein